MSNSKLNTNYKISEKTFQKLCAAIDSIGYSDAFSIALEKSIDTIKENPNSILITEYLSWSHNLVVQAKKCESEELKEKCLEVARFYRKLAHHVYWKTIKLGLTSHNPHIIQEVK